MSAVMRNIGWWLESDDLSEEEALGMDGGLWKVAGLGDGPEAGEQAIVLQVMTC